MAAPAGLHHEAGARPGAAALAGGNRAARVGGEVPAAGGRSQRGDPAGDAGPAGVREQDAAATFSATPKQELADLSLDEILQPSPRALRRNGMPGSSQKSGEVVDVLLASAPVTLGERSRADPLPQGRVGPRKTEETLARLVADLQSMLPLATRSDQGLAADARPPAGSTRRSRRPRRPWLAPKSSAILVQAPRGEPVGIVTDQDLRNRVLAPGRRPRRARLDHHERAARRASPTTPCSSRPRSLMQERDVQHLVVIDEHRRRRDSHRAGDPPHPAACDGPAARRDAERAARRRSCATASQGCRSSSRRLLDSGARVESVTRIMTAVSDAILVRLIATGRGRAWSAAGALFVRGPGQRSARGANPGHGPGQRHHLRRRAARSGTRRAQAYFLRLGEKVCGWLDEVGLPTLQGRGHGQQPEVVPAAVALARVSSPSA